MLICLRIIYLLTSKTDSGNCVKSANGEFPVSSCASRLACAVIWGDTRGGTYGIDSKHELTLICLNQFYLYELLPQEELVHSVLTGSSPNYCFEHAFVVWKYGIIVFFFLNSLPNEILQINKME